MNLVRTLKKTLTANDWACTWDITGLKWYPTDSSRPLPHFCLGYFSFHIWIYLDWIWYINRCKIWGLLDQIPKINSLSKLASFSRIFQRPWSVLQWLCQSDVYLFIFHILESEKCSVSNEPIGRLQEITFTLYTDSSISNGHHKKENIVIDLLK